jgi:TPR repeat protein
VCNAKVTYIVDAPQSYVEEHKYNFYTTTKDWFMNAAWQDVVHVNEGNATSPEGVPQTFSAQCIDENGLSSGGEPEDMRKRMEPELNAHEPAAQYLLGFMYEQELGGLEQDYVQVRCACVFFDRNLH